ncbi:nuclear transport factor 2-like protein [Sinorhizobium meliloti]|uniref:hypothetical protein n=1 Tax=Rhizobium meliloti TaxID=382 RepID=UPI000FD82C03|nr:hypothetical protein [Sinorhizobium meliloti]MDX0133445.1 hypothetical protein [Sinorhizobium meliloti]RVK41406.1 hypothetical protein CN163_06755 [Sinorhizobium meliloti]
MNAKKVVENYLQAWQQGDAKKLRSLIADKGIFGSSQLSADGLVDDMMRRPAWRDVRIVSEIYDKAGNAAILYEGTDVQTGQRVRSSEFIWVDNGLIASFDGLIVGGAPIGGRTDAMWFSAVDAI